MDKYIYDENNGLWYELVEDYYIPFSVSPNSESIKSYMPDSSQNSVIPRLSRALSVAYSVTGLHTNLAIIIKILMAMNHFAYNFRNFLIDIVLRDFAAFI